ncbi:hypothetical protein ACJJIF_06970 [Microbulbifer sp. SSSA002]|uniref:hypothetical protein n=1 Tax=Microbulbifer sp. SSSA002 TaxID=3243376 RepID=UPI004039C488
MNEIVEFQTGEVQGAESTGRQLACEFLRDVDAIDTELLVRRWARQLVNELSCPQPEAQGVLAGFLDEVLEQLYTLDIED